MKHTAQVVFKIMPSSLRVIDPALKEKYPIMNYNEKNYWTSVLNDIIF